MKQPQLLTLQEMFNTLSKNKKIPSQYFFKQGFGVALNIHVFLQPFIHATPCPYLLEDYRLGYIRQGSMHGIINLQEYTVTAGHIIFITPGTIVEPLGVSDDFLLMGMGVPADLLHLTHSGKLPGLFNGKQKHGILPVTETEGTLLEHLYRMLYETSATFEHTKENRQTAVPEERPGDVAEDKQVVHHLIAAITSYFNHLFALHQPAATTRGHTSKDIFDRFIQLVNKHCEEQRQMAFYADKLCLTERYMGTVIRKTSGITAKEWIDKAVITAAKVKLRHTDMQIAEIAERLHFPNSSFFCKYFKRLEGCTPQAYRNL